MADAKALDTTVECLNITEEKFIHYSLSTCSALDYINKKKQISLNIKIVEEKLCRCDVVTKSMSKKMCENGLTYSHLLKAH